MEGRSEEIPITEMEPEWFSRTLPTSGNSFRPYWKRRGIGSEDRKIDCTILTKNWSCVRVLCATMMDIPMDGGCRWAIELECVGMTCIGDCPDSWHCYYEALLRSEKKKEKEKRNLKVENLIVMNHEYGSDNSGKTGTVLRLLHRELRERSDTWLPIYATTRTY